MHNSYFTYIVYVQPFVVKMKQIGEVLHSYIGSYLTQRALRQMFITTFA